MTQPLKAAYLSIMDISRMVGVTYRTAFAYCHRCMVCKEFRAKCQCSAGPATIFRPTNVANSNLAYGVSWRVDRKQVDQFLKERKY